MKNPWLDVPLADYEGHMALPGIEQAQLLADILAGTLEEFLPQSVAVLGVLAEMGLRELHRVSTRVVGVRRSLRRRSWRPVWRPTQESGVDCG